MPLLSQHKTLRLMLWTLATATLAGCQEGQNAATHNPQPTPKPHEVVGSRLLISEANSQALYLFDTQTWQQSAQFALQSSPSELQTSPDGRYALALQRENDLVEVIDGGIEAQRHDDHYHLLNHVPTLLRERYQGVRPTHYETSQQQAALFFDGSKSTQQNAEFRVINDQTIGQANAVATYHFDYPVHGAAQLMGELAFTGVVTTEGGALPDTVIGMELHHDHFHPLTSLPSLPCPKLHGSAQTRDQVAFSCQDGVVHIEVRGTAILTSRIPNPANLATDGRFGTLYGYPRHGSFIAYSNTQQLFSLKNATFSEIKWKNEPSERPLAITPTDDHLFLVTQTGVLQAYSAANGFTRQFTLPLWEQAPKLAKGQRLQLTFDRRHHQLFISNPADNTVLQVDVSRHSIVRTHQLPFTPRLMAWVGTTAVEHSH